MSWHAPKIPPLAMDLAPSLRQRIDAKTKPRGALGRLEELAYRLGLIFGTDNPELFAPQVLVFAGDHGLTAEGVSSYPASVTRQMVLNFLAGGAAINAFARQHGLALTVIDAGVDGDLPAHPRLRSLKVRPGTRNARHGPALTLDEVQTCFERGAALVRELAAGGTNAVLFGEMGIGNSSAAALLVSTLLQLPLETCVGRGAGHDDAGLARKHRILAAVRERHAGVNGPVGAMAAFGGCEIAMITGAMLEAATNRMVILVDGFIVTAALAAAARICPNVTDYCVFAHVSEENGHRAALAALGGEPLLDLGLRLGEGTGAALAWPLLVAATAFLREMATFDSAGVDGARRGNHDA